MAHFAGINSHMNLLQIWVLGQRIEARRLLLLMDSSQDMALRTRMFCRRLKFSRRDLIVHTQSLTRKVPLARRRRRHRKPRWLG